MGFYQANSRDTRADAFDPTRKRAGLISAVLGLTLVLASPARAQGEPPTPVEPPPAATRPQPVPAVPGGGASDEDLEAAVLGGQVAPPRPVAPRTGTPRAPLANAPAPPAPRPPATAARERGWASSSREPGGDDGDGHPALAIELATTGLASGTLQGGLFLGARLSSSLILGGFLDYASSSSTVSLPGSPASEQSSSIFRLGAGARYPLLRTDDGRVELFAAGELGVIRRTQEVSTGGGSANNYSASGPTLAAGLGIRLWVHEHIAIGYAAQFRLTHLSGDGVAFGNSATLNPVGMVGSHAESTDINLVGTFQLLGVF